MKTEVIVTTEQEKRMEGMTVRDVFGENIALSITSVEGKPTYIDKEFDAILHIALKECQVIRYESGSGQRINLTIDQIKQLSEKRAWPKDYLGAEYCQVYKGLHLGIPTFTPYEFQEIVKRGY